MQKVRKMQCKDFQKKLSTDRQIGKGIDNISFIVQKKRIIFLTDKSYTIRFTFKILQNLMLIPHKNLS